ncbi:MAG: HAMP domain-containing histidine kinase [Candidatus Cloacimonetes bacterium]|nr:HAMP domain-containing histidine kinase [Candidatus Cloacimonadota bacterium]
MKIRFSLRAIVILLFVALYITSMVVLNSFFISKQNETNEAFQNIELDEALSELSFNTAADSLKARDIMTRFRESLAASQMIHSETQIYSSVVLFILMLISIALFSIVLYKVTRPLTELQDATAKIRQGDFSVNLPPGGIPEIRELKHSFNSMSGELNLVQKKLVEAEKQLIWKKLSRILAHEIKNPLTPIQLSVQRLEEKFELDREKFDEIFPQAIEIITQEVSNLKKLAASFSDFAKNINPTFSRFSARDALTEILRPYISHYPVTLDASTTCMISWDRTHFYQVITNLLQNAIDASGEYEPIEIVVTDHEEKVCIQIKDHGKGIDEQDMEKIFQPYFTKKKKGTGLGLALVQKLCEVNRTELRVESKIGQGSNFILTMECSDENSDN